MDLMEIKTPSRIKFDPSFVEEAVFLTVKSKEDAGEVSLSRNFHHKKNQIYESISLEKQNDFFGKLNHRFFSELGLSQFFDDILNEFPFIQAAAPSIIFKRVWSTKQEGAELYIEGQHRMLVIRLQVGRVLNLSYLESLLRFELMHISDMLDPSFQYSPNPDLGGVGKIEDELVRDRFRLLWNFYISSRLNINGHPSLVSRDILIKEINIAFSHWAHESREKLINDLEKSNSWTQKYLIKRAQDDRFNKVLGEGGLRCPLCHFTSYENKHNWKDKAPHVLKEMKKDHPNWSLSDGACSQCYEMYLSNLNLAL